MGKVQRARLRRDLVARSRRLAGVRDQRARSGGRVRQRRRQPVPQDGRAPPPPVGAPRRGRGRRVRGLGGRHARRTCRRVAAQLDAADVEVIAGKPELAADRRVVDLVQLHRPAQRDADGAALRPRGGVLAAVPAATADHRLQDRRPGARAPRDLRPRRDRRRRVLRARCSASGCPTGCWCRAWGASARSCTATHATTRSRSSPTRQPRKMIHHVMMEYTSIDDVGIGLRPRARARARDRDARSSPQRPHALLLLQEPGRLALRARARARATSTPPRGRSEHYSGFQPGGGEWGHKGLFDVM